MGSRDYRHKEAKKPKKDAKKPVVESILAPPPSYIEVEVVRKSKKGRKGEEEEEEP